jgi:hypothetical protein
MRQNSIPEEVRPMLAQSGRPMVKTAMFFGFYVDYLIRIGHGDFGT